MLRTRALIELLLTRETLFRTVYVYRHVGPLRHLDTPVVPPQPGLRLPTHLEDVLLTGGRLAVEGGHGLAGVRGAEGQAGAGRGRVVESVTVNCKRRSHSHTTTSSVTFRGAPGLESRGVALVPGAGCEGLVPEHEREDAGAGGGLAVSRSRFRISFKFHSKSHHYCV